MKFDFTKAVIISLLAHAVFLSFLIYYNIRGEEPLGSEFVSVEIIGDDFPPLEKGGQGGFQTSPPLEKGGQGGFNSSTASAGSYDASHNETNDSTLSPTFSHEGRGGSVSGYSPGSPTGNPTLTKIRAKIERSKYYPQQARLQRLEGRPEVSFRIAPNGTIESVHLAKSSGSALLDSAAIETVNRSAPLPYYDGQISLAINFTLR